MNNLNVKTLTKKDLREALKLNTYWSGKYDAPFSKNKANWLLDNERIDENDVLAIMGYENHTIAAFVFMMPDYLKLKNGSIKKIFWSHRWWVSNKYKNTILSTYVKNNSLIEVKNQVLVRFLGDNTKAYYAKQPFEKFSKRKRYIIVFSLSYDILVYKMASLKKIATVLKFIDKISGKAILTINRIKSAKRIKGLTYKYIESIDDNNWVFIEKHCVNDIIPKTKDYINWQINNKQYNVLSTVDKLRNKCLLESESKNINNLSFFVINNNETIGFISAQVRGKRFVLRYFLTDTNNFDNCINALMNSMIKSKCTLIQTENVDVGEKIRNKYLNLHSSIKELFSLNHNDIDYNFEEVQVKDQDGSFY